MTPKYYHTFRFNPRSQLGPMKRAFPNLKVEMGSGGIIIWRGILQPTSHSTSYNIKLAYSPSRPPQIWISRPKLHPKAPHVFGNRSLCLYWHREWWWSDSESLANTIVAWAILWLHYYEIWLVTGEWLGPSSHQSESNPTVHDNGRFSLSQGSVSQ